MASKHKPHCRYCGHRTKHRKQALPANQYALWCLECGRMTAIVQRAVVGIT